MRLVVIEDSATQAERIRVVLAASGHDVAVARDGAEGLELCYQLDPPPDAVLTDVVMPNIDGFEVCRRLRADARLSKVPIMFLTSLADPKDVLEAIAAGGDNFVTKPVDPAVLEARLQRMVHHRDPTDARVELDGKTYDLGASPAQLVDILVSCLTDAAARYHELERKREEMARDNAAREEMMRVVAHELRNPLQSLSLMADLLRQSELGPDIVTIPDRLDRQSKRMVRIIDDLSDVSKIEIGSLRVTRRAGELGSLVREAVERAIDTYPSHRFELELKSEFAARFDGGRIEQVLGNFLSNAVKYSPEGSLVRAQVVAQDGAARVLVSDEGIGIAEDDRDRVFDRYFPRPQGRAPRRWRWARVVHLQTLDRGPRRPGGRH